MMRRSAACASCVIESASSSTMSLYGGQGYFELSCSFASELRDKLNVAKSRNVPSRFGRDGQLRETLDFFAHYANAALVGRVQLEHSVFENLWTVRQICELKLFFFCSRACAFVHTHTHTHP